MDLLSPGRPGLGGFARTGCLAGHRLLPNSGQPIQQCTVQAVVEVDILLLWVDMVKVPHLTEKHSPGVPNP